MNTEMNNNDRKKHSKTLAIAGMGFLLIAAAFTFSFANSGEQLVNAQQNQTAAGGNQTAAGGTATQTIVAIPYDTFTGSGPITATIGGGQGSPYILGGNWNLNVQQANVTDFSANFQMVHTNGSGGHTHNITSFVTGTPNVELVQGQNTSITGVADIYTNGTIAWPGANTTLTFLQNGAVMTIMPDPAQTDNHFQGQPIYGIVSGLTGENGTAIVQATPPGQQQEQQQQQEEEGGGPLEALTGGGEQQQQQQQGGNQSDGGGPLGGIGEQIGELFGGGGG